MGGNRGYRSNHIQSEGGPFVLRQKLSHSFKKFNTYLEPRKFMGCFENRTHQACSGTGRRNGGLCHDCNGMGYRVRPAKCDDCEQSGENCKC